MRLIFALVWSELYQSLVERWSVHDQWQNTPWCWATLYTFEIGFQGQGRQGLRNRQRNKQKDTDKRADKQAYALP